VNSWHRTVQRHCLLSVIALCTLPLATPAAALELYTRDIKINGDHWALELPTGYRLDVLTTRLDGPRLMTFLDNGDLLIGSKSGKVYRLAPPYTQPEVLVTLDNYPHSLAWRNGMLYIAQTDGLYQVPYRPGQRRIDRDDVTLLAPLPGGGGHSSRTVGVGPDGRLYIALGITGNCSNEYLDDGYAFGDRRGGVLVLDETGATPRLQPFASGLRNPVGFDWHPLSGELFASNNGPDHLGFGQPPEYFSQLTAGSFHGMPWFQYDGTRLIRDRCVRQPPPRPQADVTLPVATFPARNAPMGVAFVPAGAMDPRFAGNAIVALRGSWGTQPDGGSFGNKATRRPPGLVMVPFDKGKPAGTVSAILTGLQRPDGERLLRPVGVAIGPDGALYFTSDSRLQGLFRLRKTGQ
jgi:glucose/arabinose dehydrogenase